MRPKLMTWNTAMCYVEVVGRDSFLSSWDGIRMMMSAVLIKSHLVVLTVWAVVGFGQWIPIVSTLYYQKLLGLALVYSPRTRIPRKKICVWHMRIFHHPSRGPITKLASVENEIFHVFFLPVSSFPLSFLCVLRQMENRRQGKRQSLS